MGILTMNRLQIVLPMAGLGLRFSKEGYSLPKPLIPVDGVPMFQQAINSFKLILEKNPDYIGKKIAIIRRQHQSEYQLETLLKNSDQSLVVKILPELTRGAAETSFLVKDLVSMDSPIIFIDCDLWFESENFFKFIISCIEGQETHIAGAVCTFTSDSVKYSYVSTDSNSFITDIAEKKPISRSAVIGAYFFRKASYFFDEAEEVLKNPLANPGEYYTSIIIKNLIAKNFKFKAFKNDSYFSFGTPEELALYQQRII